MKKLEGRAFLCLILVLCLVAGLALFVGRLVVHGDDWASFYANQHVFKSGRLKVGEVYDRNGVLLLQNDSEGAHYNTDTEVRKATFHLVGDQGYNIETGANNAFRSKLIGYNFVTGTNGFVTDKRALKLTIDSDLNVTAYKALNGRKGFVSVYNWKTGEILCMVSSPAADPAYLTDSSQASEGTYINKVLSASFTPGSTFKLVTTAAAIENLEGLDSWTYTCTGSTEIDGEKITCPKAHGTMEFYGALANSCNCAYAELAVELGPDKMKKIVKDVGLTDSYDVDGVKTEPGKFNFDTYDINLGWAGIGQFEDSVNPLSMMVYMGAIAGEGTAAKPVLLKEITLKGENSALNGTVNLLRAGTARQISDMMRNNVVSNYGDDNYPGLELHAKTGTAEVGSGKAPHAWMTGFSGDYAFAVCVENGGGGAAVAGPAANKVLQQLVNNNQN